jgi:hypothetical protein
MGGHVVTASPVILSLNWKNEGVVHSVSAHTVLSEGITSDPIMYFRKLKTACHIGDHMEIGGQTSSARVDQFVSHLRAF